MSSEAELTPEPARPKPRAEFEAQPDRERRNPFYRWLMHIGLPVGLSIILHILLFGAAAMKSLAVAAQRVIDVGEYEAGLVESPDDRLDEVFQWTEQVSLEAPEIEPLADLSFSDFSRVDTLDHAAFDETATGEIGAGESDLGIGEGRLSLLGTGSGAGEAGSGGFGGGAGMGGRRLGQAGMWDIRIQANKIAYVVDFSGSIIVAVDDLKRELKRSIGRLRPSQSFNVLVFYSQDERSKSDAFASVLQPATEQTRQAFFKWLARRSPKGGTDPLPSMKRALALRPEAVFFFSDGLFDDSVVDEITRANRSARAKVYCFLFDEMLLGDTSGLPSEPEGARRLRKIAQQNRGKLKIVTGADLGRR